MKYEHKIVWNGVVYKLKFCLQDQDGNTLLETFLKDKDYGYHLVFYSEQEAREGLNKFLSEESTEWTTVV